MAASSNCGSVRVPGSMYLPNMERAWLVIKVLLQLGEYTTLVNFVQLLGLVQISFMVCCLKAGTDRDWSRKISRLLHPSVQQLSDINVLSLNIISGEKTLSSSSWSAFRMSCLDGKSVEKLYLGQLLTRIINSWLFWCNLTPSVLFINLNLLRVSLRLRTESCWSIFRRRRLRALWTCEGPKILAIREGSILQCTGLLHDSIPLVWLQPWSTGTDCRFSQLTWLTV